jgi:hypothetical protein
VYPTDHCRRDLHLSHALFRGLPFASGNFERGSSYSSIGDLDGVVVMTLVRRWAAVAIVELLCPWKLKVLARARRLPHFQEVGRHGSSSGYSGCGKADSRVFLPWIVQDMIELMYRQKTQVKQMCYQ